MRSQRAGPSPGQLSLGFEDDPSAIAGLLIDELRAADPTSRLIPELGLVGARARIDVAQVSIRHLSGYEIKSGRDGLDRLAHQITAFSMVFERLSLVVAPCHTAQVVARTPGWWGVGVAADRSIDWIREPASNPSLQIEAMAALLWREEAEILGAAMLGKRVRGTRTQLIALLAREADPSLLSAGVRRALIQRTGWRAAA